MQNSIDGNRSHVGWRTATSEPAMFGKIAALERQAARRTGGFQVGVSFERRSCFGFPLRETRPADFAVVVYPVIIRKLRTADRTLSDDAFFGDEFDEGHHCSAPH